MIELERNIDSSDRSGSVSLKPENVEDLWQIHNLIAVGDTVSSPSTRFLRRTIPLYIWHKRSPDAGSIRVFFCTVDKYKATLRLTGEISFEMSTIPGPIFGTLELKSLQPLVIYREYWDLASVQRLDQAVNNRDDADFAVIIMERGIARIMQVSRSVTTVTVCANYIAKLETGMDFIDSKLIQIFHKQLLNKISKQVNFDKLKFVAISSPSQEHWSFRDYAQSINSGDRKMQLKNNTAKLVDTKTVSAKISEFREVLRQPEVRKLISKTGLCHQFKLLERFRKRIDEQMKTATFGPARVQYAMSRNAVETILIADDLLPKCGMSSHEKYVQLLDEACVKGVTVEIISTQHFMVAYFGERYRIAAILKFPVVQLDKINQNDDLYI